MVAITVILAAVIAAFVFGMGPPEQAPQASIRGSADTSNCSVLKLEHQGGEVINLLDSNTKITVDGNVVDLSTLTTPEQKFDAGETMYLWSESGTLVIGNSTTLADGDATIDIGDSGDIVNVKVVDVGSQQMIADLKVTY